MDPVDTVEEPHPVQIITYNKSSRKFELQLDLLESILLADDVRGANLAIVSIAGAFRKGKSFMLGFFLRYMDSVYVRGETDWLGDENQELSGFAWRGGSNRHTTGIWIWSKIFTKILPSGEKIGVILMDTQGTFDSSSTMRDNVTIFSLSTMLSSIQIYNLFNNIQEDNLQQLQLFTEYGRLAGEQNNEKAFQMLLFLIRDWSFPYEAGYGFEGGREILNNALKISDDQDDELKYVRTHIKSCYERLDCFLMPHPGREATVSQFFTGRLRDIEPGFLAMLKEFVPALLSPQTVLVKRVNQVKVNGLNFLTYIETYFKIFDTAALPTVQTILSATAEANNLSAKEEALEYYFRQMEINTTTSQPYLEFIQMVEIQNKILKEALNRFRSKAVFGPESMREMYHQKLNDELHSHFLMFLGQNESKKVKAQKAILDNLTLQITQFSNITQDQTSQIQRLQEQMEEYRKQDENQKDHLRQELRQLPRRSYRRSRPHRQSRVPPTGVQNRSSRVAAAGTRNRSTRPVRVTPPTPDTFQRVALTAEASGGGARIPNRPSRGQVDLAPKSN